MSLQIEGLLETSGPGDVTVAVLPFFHIYGMEVLMNLLSGRGAVSVTLPRFDLPAVLQADRGASDAAISTSCRQWCWRWPSIRSSTSTTCRRCELVISGAAPLGADLTRACADRLGCEVAQGYGMTEMSPVTHMSRDRRHAARRVGRTRSQHRGADRRSRHRPRCRTRGRGRTLGARARR